MEEIREPAKVTRPAREHELDQAPEAVAASTPIIEVPISERMKAVLLREHRRIT